MKYKTISIIYPSGEGVCNLIDGMSEYGWGLMHMTKPDYPTGDKYGHYTFFGGDNAVDVHYNFYGSPQITIKKGEEVTE